MGIRIYCNPVISGSPKISSVLKMNVRLPLTCRLTRVARMAAEPKKVKHVAFLSKYLELQRAMFYHNNALTSSHPYASQPISWPFLLRGVSFWTKGDEVRQQIYFLGNPVGWWVAVGFLSVFTGILFADQISRRRGLETIEERSSPLPLPRCGLLTSSRAI
jgi:dolichyl-phosphate-mannose--protein O-mannosyl transferase